MPLKRKSPRTRAGKSSAPTVRRQENPSWVLLPASAGLGRPPTRPQLATLPFHELDWPNFERLCYRLAKRYGDIERWAALFGRPGQSQDGIDIYARPTDSERFSCWQVKRHRRLTKTNLKAAIAEFEAGEWMAKSDEFIICSAAPIQDTTLQREIEAQTIRLRDKKLKLTVLGAQELSDELKNKPGLVLDFFGRHWSRAFCASDDEGVATRLDAADVATLRIELHQLYMANFSVLDPGIVIGSSGGSTDGHTLLPILERFVEPDIEVSEAGIQNQPTEMPVEPAPVQDSDLQPMTLASGRPAPVRDRLRRRVSSWVAEGDYAVIVGDAGFGKSTTLRAFALDLLEMGARFPALTQRWGDRVPIIMPFAFWVRLVEQGEHNISLRDALTTWFRKFGVSDALLNLIQRSLDEKKLLLLVDGLDEWTNSTAAGTTLTLLDTVARTGEIPAILSGRPGGLARLGGLDLNWRHGHLAALSDSQQRSLVRIWFGHLHRRNAGGPANGKQSSHVTLQVDQFFADLAQAGRLTNLSGVPLILSGLISLFVRKVALPRNRFQAYDELIQLLLEVHPRNRARAAMDRAPRSTLLRDIPLLKRSLACFAFQKRTRGLDLGCPIADARSIVVEYLQSLDGAGLPAHDAIAGATALLGIDADTAGLLVEKAPGEVGFVHAVFEEMLAGLHLAGWTLERQQDFNARNAGDPRWTTSILAMLHHLTRASDVDQLVERLMPTEIRSPGDIARQALVAEVIFGDFQCSPRQAAKLTPTFLELVSQDTWPPLRQTIAHLVTEAALSGRGPEAIHGTPDEWFPDPLTLRQNVYPALAHWPKDLALPLLWKGLFNEQSENKRAAAAALTGIFRGDIDVGKRLHDLCHTVCDVQTLCAALEALMDGWWDAAGLTPLLTAARESNHDLLRLVGIRGRIKRGEQDDVDRDEVMAMASVSQFPGDAPPDALRTLLAGWPNDAKIIETSLKALEHYGREEGLDREIAKRYLLHASRANRDLDEKLAKLIRKDEHFFSMFFGNAYLPGTYGPSVTAALDHHLDRINEHFQYQIAHMAAMSRSDHAKQRLITLLVADDKWPFWPVYGLLAGWGMGDEEVAAALKTAAARPPERRQYIAHHLPEILPDKVACRAALLEIARLPTVSRLDFLVAGFARTGVTSDDAEVTDLLLALAADGRSGFGGADALFSGFATDPRVRAIALRRVHEFEPPWETLSVAYAGDSEIRAVITRYLSTVPATLRSVVVASLARRASDDEASARRLAGYRLEAHPGVRTAAAIGYYRAIVPDQSRRSDTLASLKTEMNATGPWHDLIQQAALAGYIALDEVKAFVDQPGWLPDKKLTVDVFSLDNNPQILSFVARHWGRMRAAAGSDLLSRLSRFEAHEWYCWDHLAPYVGESESLKSEFLEFCRGRATSLSSRGIEALAREVPRSRLLRDHCLRFLNSNTTDVNMSPFDRKRAELVVGRILARHFAHDTAARDALEQRSEFHHSAAIVGLSTAWRASPVLAAEFSRMRDNIRSRQYIWPDVVYLSASLGSRQEFCHFLDRLLESATGYLWDFLPFSIEPIVERIRSDEGLAAHLVGLLKCRRSGSARASLPRLLAFANLMTDELRGFCEAEFAKQMDGSALPEFGLDIVAGEFRPVAHALLDALATSTR